MENRKTDQEVLQSFLAVIRWGSAQSGITGDGDDKRLGSDYILKVKSTGIS